MGNKIITNFSMFNESEAYVFEDSKKPKTPLMVPTEETLIEIMERQKKWNSGKTYKPTTASYKKWKQRQDSLEIYNKMNPEEKAKVLEQVKEKFIQKKITDEKYKKVISQSSNRDSKNSMYSKPYIIVTKEELITTDPGIIDNEPEEEVKFPPELSLIPDKNKNNFFKDNRWENTPDAYADPNGLAIVKENLEAIEDIIAADINANGKGIEKITIVSSCSRLRNTGSKTLSWYELSKKRSETFTQILLDRIKELDLDEEYKKSLIDKIFITFSGFNGDGTSGPDPLPTYRRGYYDKSGKFIDEAEGKLKGKNTLDILVTDNGQQPKLQKAVDLNGSSMSTELKNNETDYIKYQYNDIIITFNPEEINKKPEKTEEKNNETPPKTKIINSYKCLVDISSSEWTPPKSPPRKKRVRKNRLKNMFKRIRIRLNQVDWSKCQMAKCSQPS